MAATAPANEETLGDYKVTKDKTHELGFGSYGRVYRGVRVSNNDPVAVKIMTGHKQHVNLDEQEKEAKLLKSIPPHENVVKMHDFIKNEYDDDGLQMIEFWLVTELCPLGNLSKYAMKNELSIRKKIDLMFQAARGVEHLHSQPDKVVHRDIKPENILITGNVRRPIVRLCDFGCARTVMRVNNQSVLMKTLAGTQSYWAPEQHKIRSGDLSYDKSIDTFSLGVSNLALLESSKGSIPMPHLVDGKPIGQALYEMQPESRRHFTIDIDKSSDTDIVSRVKDIIKKMIVCEPADRLSMNKVVSRLSEIRDSLQPDEVLLAAKERSVWVRVGSEWEKQTDLSKNHPDENICFCALPDGVVAVGGGYEDNVSSMCHHFSVCTRTWRRLPDMPTVRRDASAVMPEDVLMVLGGCDKDNQKLAVCEKFHMADGVWSSAAPMLEPLWRPLVAAAAGKVYIVPRDFPSSTTIQVYDVTANTFSWTAQLPQHPQNILGACLVAVDEKLYLLGGKQRLAVQYNPAVAQWTQLQSQPSATYDWGCCGVVHYGKLLLCGGDTTGEDKNLVEEFDINTQQWKTTRIKIPFAFTYWDSLVASIDV